MNDKKFIKLTPFKMQVLQSFPFIDEDFDAITNYELLCKVVEYLNTTVNNVNVLSDNFNTLKDYVENYFTNLDVQEEINNKLDEMAESGELTDIIAQYLGLAGVLAFNTVNDMKNATNLVNGSIAKTLGFYNYNDLGGAYYKIRTITNEDIVDEKTIISLSNESLIAELILTSSMNVEVFGAYGDNTNDDTLSIQTAINKCKEVILSKTYKTTSQIIINSNCNIIGLNATINSTLSENNSVFKVLSNNVNFKGLTIELNYTGGGSTGEDGCTICFGTYRMTESLGLKNFVIDGCNIKRTGTLSYNIGIFGDTHDIIIRNCKLYGEAINMHWSGDFNPSLPDTSPCTVTYHPYNIIIENNELENNRGIFLSSAYNVKILNNIFKNNTTPITLSIGDYGSTLATNIQKESIMTGITIDNCSFNEYTNQAITMSGFGSRSGDSTYNKNYITKSKVSINNCSFNDTSSNSGTSIIGATLFYGLTISNCNFNAPSRYNGIYVLPLFDSKITNCNFNVIGTPITINGGDNLIIERCKASILSGYNFIKTQNYQLDFTGILYKVNNIVIDNNECDGATTLINLANTKNTIIKNNRILRCNIGINAGDETSDLSIINNKFSDSSNTLVGSHFNVVLTSTVNANIERNMFNGSRGTRIDGNAIDIKLLNNTMINNPFNNGLLCVINARNNKEIYLINNLVDVTASLVYGTNYKTITYVEN